MSDNFTSELKRVAPVVLQILKDDPGSRDSDKRLMSFVWEKEQRDRGFDPARTTQHLRDGIISNPESITRSRRKAQEEFPEVRGEKYYKRHKEQEVVKIVIKQPDLFDGVDCDGESYF